MSSKGACGLWLMLAGYKGLAPVRQRQTQYALRACSEQGAAHATRVKIPLRVIEARGTPHTKTQAEHLSDTVKKQNYGGNT